MYFEEAHATCKPGDVACRDTSRRLFNMMQDTHRYMPHSPRACTEPCVLSTMVNRSPLKWGRSCSLSPFFFRTYLLNLFAVLFFLLICLKIKKLITTISKLSRKYSWTKMLKKLWNYICCCKTNITLFSWSLCLSSQKLTCLCLFCFKLLQTRRSLLYAWSILFQSWLLWFVIKLMITCSSSRKVVFCVPTPSSTITNVEVDPQRPAALIIPQDEIQMSEC